MRIIAGKFKGTNLLIPENKVTRPLKDLVRESIFNLLKHSNKISFEIEKKNILDLYSGTGSFGLECLSRNAKKVFFIEKEKNILKILKQNIEKLKLKDETKVFSDDVLKLIQKQNIFELKFDLIFCDPPFKDTNIGQLIKLILEKKILKKNGIIIFHRNKKNTQNKHPGFKIIEERIYGISKITFGKILI
jgi:16S rRNA (guanine966-N2)-methyltransferase